VTAPHERSRLRSTSYVSNEGASAGVARLRDTQQYGDRVCLGDNQKKADMLARALAEVDPAKIHDLDMVQSGLTGRRAGSAPGRSRTMEILRFELAEPTSAKGIRKTALVGVVDSGTLEVLLEREGPADRCTIEINTSAHGFIPLWETVV
jgi:Malonate decarboxylase, alpha subunit, transporter/Malonate decarboxylase delta subunit (MdcD)